jgi:hypothetical protein
MSNEMDLGQFMELWRLKKENPKEYEEFLVAVKDIYKDVVKLLKEVMEEMKE